MKKLIIGIVLLACVGSANAQFQNIDSLRKFINKYIRNSAIDAFTNLRLNTALNGLANFTDSAYNASPASKLDSVVLYHDSILISYKGAVVTRRDTISVAGTGGSGSTNSNLGSGYRIGVTLTNYLKTLTGHAFVLYDTTTTGQIDIRIDTASLAIWLTNNHPYRLIVDSNFAVHVGPPDTLVCLHCGAGGGSVSMYIDNASFSGDPSNPNNPMRLKLVGTAGTYGNSTTIPVTTTDSLGRVINVTPTAIPTATPTQLGLVKVDNSTITISGGVISSTGGSGSGTPAGSKQQVQVNRGVFGVVNNFTADTVTGRVNADTLTAKRVRADSVQLNPNGYTNPVTKADSVSSFGTSITNGLNSSPQDSSYASRVAVNFGLPLENRGVSGSIAFSAITIMNANINPGHHALTTIELGFNDLRNSGATVYNEVTNALVSAITNQYLSSYASGGSGSVTRYGTWTTSWDATGQAGGKSINGAYTTNLNDSLVYTTGVGTCVAVGLIGTSGAFGSNVQVYIDNVLTATVNTANQGYSGSYITMARYYPGLANTTHVVKVVRASGGTLMAIDYIGIMNPTIKEPFVALGVPNQIYAGTVNGNNTQAVTDTLSARIKFYANTALAAGFPVYYADLKAYYPGTLGSGGISSDSIHPSNTGHRYISQAVIAALSNPVSAGMLQAGNDGFLYYGGKKVGLYNSTGIQNAINNNPNISAPSTIFGNGYKFSFLNTDTFNISNVLRVKQDISDINNKAYVNGSLYINGTGATLNLQSRNGGNGFGIYSPDTRLLFTDSYNSNRAIFGMDTSYHTVIYNKFPGGAPTPLNQAALEILGNYYGENNHVPLIVRPGNLTTTNSVRHSLQYDGLIWTLTDSTNFRDTIAMRQWVRGIALKDPTTTAGDIIYRNGAGVLTRLALGGPQQTLHVGTGAPVWKDTLASGNLGGSYGLSRTATATDGGTTPSDGVTHKYSVATGVTITAISSGTLTVTVVYTNDQNVSTTKTFYEMGATTAALSSTGASNFPVMGEITCKPGTTITLTYTFAGTSIGYNYHYTITKMD